MASTAPMLREDGVERHEVAVDIGEHGDAHRNEFSSALSHHGRRRRVAGSRG